MKAFLMSLVLLAAISGVAAAALSFVGRSSSVAFQAKDTVRLGPAEIAR